jgi:hypothetical protein
MQLELAFHGPLAHDLVIKFLGFGQIRVQTRDKFSNELAFLRVDHGRILSMAGMQLQEDADPEFNSPFLELGQFFDSCYPS